MLSREHLGVRHITSKRKRASGVEGGVAILPTGEVVGFDAWSILAAYEPNAEPIDNYPQTGVATREWPPVPIVISVLDAGLVSKAIPQVRALPALNRAVITGEIEVQVAPTVDMEVGGAEAMTARVGSKVEFFTTDLDETHVIKAEVQSWQPKLFPELAKGKVVGTLTMRVESLEGVVAALKAIGAEVVRLDVLDVAGQPRIRLSGAAESLRFVGIVTGCDGNADVPVLPSAVPKE